MKAVAARGFGGVEQLELVDLPVPAVAADGILVRVRATTVGPWDVRMRAGAMGTEFPLPLVLGTECAGVVEQVGAEVSDFEPGDEVFVYAFMGAMHAELAAVTASLAAPKPASLSFEEAAAVPVSGITAHQAVHEDVALQTDESALITAAAGGTGTFAVQLAKERGARVLATASEPHHDYVRSLGADDVYAYRGTDFAAAIRETVPEGVDALLDFVGSENFERSLAAVRDGGRAVSTVPPVPEDPGRGIRASFVFGRPDGERLRELARLIDAGELRLHVEEVIPLAEAARAHELVGAGHVQGKVVLRVE